MTVRTAIDRFRFRGNILIPATASTDAGIWTSAITGSGPPTVSVVSGGAAALALEATEEVQNACLYMGDVLPYDIDDLIRVEFLAKMSATLGSASSIAFGVGSARNDDPDSITAAAMFRAIGNNSIVCETDDGTNEQDDDATGDTITTSYKRFVIDFASGIKTQSPPSLSLGGKADIHFLMSGAYGSGALRRVCAGTAHSMNAYSGNLQLFAQIQKTSSTNTGTLSILEIDVEYKLPA
jgi:hypothetical protein